MSLIKTSEQIKLMRQAGQILGGIMGELSLMIKPDLPTINLEERFINLCEKYNVIPACKGYTSGGLLPPFPTGLCVSVNNQSVHCFPTKGQMINTGDVITIDTVIKYKGLHADAAFAKGIGKIDKKNQLLLDTSLGALLACIELVKPKVTVGYIAHNMERYVKANGLNVLTDYAGHGIGLDMHELPEIPCQGNPHDGPVLQTGMTICIESLVCQGNPKVDSDDDWPTKMRDGKNFAQFEHTVLVTDIGYEILTPFKV